jgi:hypothetical protein
MFKHQRSSFIYLFSFYMLKNKEKTKTKTKIKTKTKTKRPIGDETQHDGHTHSNASNEFERNNEVTNHHDRLDRS